jgi:hypothetical protein
VESKALMPVPCIEGELLEQIKCVDVSGNLSIGQYADLQEGRHHGPI